jgi:phage shock protein C
MKRLYRSSTDRVISGVCGGFAEYLNIDSVIIRLVWALFIFFGGFGLLAYIIAAIVIPIEPIGEARQEEKRVKHIASASTPSFFPLMIGLLFIIMGFSVLGHNIGWHVFGWVSIRKIMWIFIPSVIILFGILLIFRALSPEQSYERKASKLRPDEPLPDPDGKAAKTVENKDSPVKEKNEHSIKEEPSFSKSSSTDKKTSGKRSKTKDTDKGSGKNTHERPKTLRRNIDERLISGVCAGLADYLDIDVSIVRFLWVIMTLMTGGIGGVIAYIVMVFVVPPN